MAAIKITALGRPNLLLQLSETIVRTRRYFKEVSGQNAEAGLQDAHIPKDQFANRFKVENFKDKPELKEFLAGMTYDRQG